MRRLQLGIFENHGISPFIQRRRRSVRRSLSKRRLTLMCCSGLSNLYRTSQRALRWRGILELASPTISDPVLCFLSSRGPRQKAEILERHREANVAVPQLGMLMVAELCRVQPLAPAATRATCWSNKTLAAGDRLQDPLPLPL